jgi:hypothetical protein
LKSGYDCDSSSSVVAVTNKMASKASHMFFPVDNVAKPSGFPAYSADLECFITWSTPTESARQCLKSCSQKIQDSSVGFSVRSKSYISVP